MQRLLTLPVSAFTLLLVLTAMGSSSIPAIAEGTQSAEDEIYVPKDLDDSFRALKELLDQATIDEMRNGGEAGMIQYHFGLGMWLRNNWGLWGGSRLAKWFNDRGIHHPDDMSGIILDSFWRHLNDRPIKLQEQIRYYQDFWRRTGKR